ncbi:MAG: hypothetical protein WAR83_15175 [Flavobacteriales bacterium]
MILFGSVQAACSQFGNAYTATYAWSAEPHWESAWNNDTLSERSGAIVLSDDLSIRFRNNKPEFLALFFERTRIIKFTSTKGILDHGRFHLPESLDPIFDQRDTPWDKRSVVPDPQWMNVRLDHFAARVIRPDGSWEELPVFTRILNSEVQAMRTIENVWRCRMDVQGILPGDVVEVTWKYMLPYDANYPHSLGWRGQYWVDNWTKLTSWRMFFHGLMPIRKQHVEVQYNKKHGLIVGGTSYFKFSEKKNEITLKWDHFDLKACMDEVNARPSYDLPFVSFRMESDDQRYWWRDRYTGLPVKQTYWQYVIRSREQRALWWKQVAQRKVVLDKQNKLLKAYVDRVAGFPLASSAAERMAAMHNNIAQEFSYENDRLWYLDLDRKLAKIGEQLDEKRIRRISRYDLYAKLINELKVDYSTAYVLDKRVGSMNDHFLTPLWESEFLFAIRNGDRLMWMHPKQRDQGLLADELPFYWQGTPALTVNLTTLIQDLPGPPVFIDLPEPGATENVRGVEYKVNVDLNSTATVGNVKVYLSGQFSTLGRPAYLGNAIDSTVDPLYGSQAFDVKGIVALSKGKHMLNTDQPFRFMTSADVRMTNMVSPVPDSTFTIDLGRFIQHVVPQNFVASTRDSPFYWDFIQEDQSIVDLYFDEPVTMLPLETNDSSVHSEGAQYELRIQQMAPDHLQMKSRFIVTQEKESVSMADDIEALIKAASKEDRTVKVDRVVRVQ